MRRKHLIEILIQGIIICVSYILAVFIRYYLLSAMPGINALSSQYLLIALVYSILIACTFKYHDIPRFITYRSSGSFEVLLKNAIGCLLLLSFFYFAGVIHFSRLALFLFWLLSSTGLLLMRIIKYSVTARRRRNGQDTQTVLLVGDGALAKEYIESIDKNEQFGIRIKGYVGKDDGLATDLSAWFEPENYQGQVIRYLGTEVTEEVLDSAEKIVLADVDGERTRRVLMMAHSHGISASMVIPNSKFIRNETGARSLGTSKELALNEAPEEFLGTLPVTGMVVSIAAFILILITKRFDIGAMGGNVGGFESYRNIFFATFCFFLFLKLKGDGDGGILKKTGICFIATIVGAVIYEMLYGASVDLQKDFLIITIVTIGCAAVSLAKLFLIQNDMIFME